MNDRNIEFMKRNASESFVEKYF